VVCAPVSTWAYRPFVSTDAAVADVKEVEIEGYFNFERTRRENTITTPAVVLNYGVAKNWELVGEFRVERRSGISSWGGRCPRAMSVLSRLTGCCRPQKAVRSSSSSGMTPRRGSQRASFGLHARGNEECRADTIGLVPVGRPKSLVDMLLSPALPEPPGQATRAIVRCQS